MASKRKGKGEKRSRKSGKSDTNLHRNNNGTWLRLVAHRLFAPAVGLWGALLGAGVVIVVPEAHIEALTEGTLIATFGVSVKLLMIGGFALLLGAATFGIAASRSAAARRRVSPGSVLNIVTRHVNPIDPERDLGSKSIDDPIEAMPFASPAWRDADADDDMPSDEDDAEEEQPLPRFLRRRRREPEIEADDEQDEALRAPAAPVWRDAAVQGEEPQPLPRFMTHPIPDPVPASPSESAPDALLGHPPIELDLAAFAELPGRNAVWVEVPADPAPVSEPVPAPAPAPSPVAAPAVAAVPQAPALQEPRRRAASPPPAPGSAALARLRAVPTNELSIAEMVERFAGALHEHRASAPARKLSAAELAARETALAEAIKALTALSGIGADAAPTDREEPLRAALTQLQPRRGAA